MTDTSELVENSMSDTIVFHGGVQVASFGGRDWVPRDDYDALASRLEAALDTLREIDDACSDYDPTYIREIAREAHTPGESGNAAIDAARSEGEKP